MFHDTTGNEYVVSSAPSAIANEYGLTEKPELIIVATSSATNPKYTKQLKYLKSLDAEKHGYLIITANSQETAESGYYTSTESAKTLLKGNDFRVVILNNDAEVTLSKTSPISDKIVLEHLRKQDTE